MGSSLPRQPKKEKIGESLGSCADCSKKELNRKLLPGVTFHFFEEADPLQTRWGMCQLLGPGHPSAPLRATLRRSDIRVCLQSCASPMMDLVIKQLWPILITHLGTAAWQEDCLPLYQRSKVYSFRIIHPVLPRIHVSTSCPIGVPTRNKVPFIPWECMLKGAGEDRAHCAWKLVLIITVKEKNKSV